LIKDGGEGAERRHRSIDEMKILKFRKKVRKETMRRKLYSDKDRAGGGVVGLALLAMRVIVSQDAI
jgi:hypothetical protein